MTSTISTTEKILHVIQHFLLQQEGQQQHQPRFLTHVVSGSRGSGKTFLLDQIHKSIATLGTSKIHHSSSSSSSSTSYSFLCKQQTEIPSVAASSSPISTSPKKTIYHFHSCGTPSDLQKMTIDVELFVNKELIPEQEQDEDEEETKSKRSAVILATVDDLDLILMLNKFHDNSENGNNSNDDDDKSGNSNSSGASRFAQKGSSSSKKDEEDRKKSFWGWFYDHYFNKEKNNESEAITNIDVILIVCTSSSSSNFSSAETLIANSSSTNWIFPDALTWNLSGFQQNPTLLFENNNNGNVGDFSFENKIIFLKSIIPETMRKVTMTDLNLILAENNNDNDCKSLLEFALLLTQLKKQNNDKSSASTQEQTSSGDEMNRVLNLLTKKTGYDDLIKMKDVKTTPNEREIKYSSMAKRSGCFTAFSRLVETIERFGLFYNNTNNNNSNTEQEQNNETDATIQHKKKTQGKVAAALQPPSGILVIDGKRKDGRAQSVIELATKHVLALKNTSSEEENVGAFSSISVHAVQAPLLFGPVFGETEERIRAAFNDAYAQRPCVLVIQDVDAIAVSRGSLSASSGSSSSSSTGVSGNVLQRAVATFLCEADGVDRPDRASSVLIIASTSNKKDLDSAALRPGRLEMHVEMDDFFLNESNDDDDGRKDKGDENHIVRKDKRSPNVVSDSSKTLVESWFEFCDADDEKPNNEKSSLRKFQIVNCANPGKLRSELEKYFQDVLVEDALRLLHSFVMRLKKNTSYQVSEEEVRKYFNFS